VDESDLEKAILKKVYVWVVVGAMAAGGVGSLGLARVGEFNSHDADFLKREIMLEVKRLHTECQQMINTVEATKPPGLTRQRIQAVEESVRRLDPKYKQPTWEWN
jgi:hypothetical protein